MLSVVLCTYNGQDYLKEQLNSLFSQTLGPDEVVVRDDCSTDETIAVVERFAQSNGEICFASSVNNVGATQNFSQAIARSRGDVIFCCDQDDIWIPEKLEVIEATFAGRPDVGYVFTNAARINESGEELPKTLWESLPVAFDHKRQREFVDHGFGQLLRSNVVTGCTLAFRSEFKSLVLPIPEAWVHDAWIAVCISAVSSGLPIAEKLVRYRQHAGQQIGERRRGLVAQYRMAARMGKARFERELVCHEVLLERLTSQSRWPVEEWKLDLLRQKIRFLSDRVKMRERFVRSPLILKHVLSQSYGRFAFGWKSIAQDLLIRN